MPAILRFVIAAYFAICGFALIAVSVTLLLTLMASKADAKWTLGHIDASGEFVVLEDDLQLDECADRAEELDVFCDWVPAEE